MPEFEYIFPVFNYISLGVGVFGIIVIVLGAIRTFAKVILIEISRDTERKTTKERQKLRRQLSSYLLLGLELLIAGDVIRTIIRPNLEEIAVLGCIVIISLLQMKLCAKWSQNSDVSIKNPLSPKQG